MHTVTKTISGFNHKDHISLSEHNVSNIKDSIFFVFSSYDFKMCLNDAYAIIAEVFKVGILQIKSFRGKTAFNSKEANGSNMTNGVEELHIDSGYCSYCALRKRRQPASLLIYH